MERRAWFAGVLFMALCVGGITTLLSQTSLAPGPGGALPSERTTLDPGNGSRGDFGTLVPLSLRKGAEARARTATSGTEEGKPRVLRLR